LAGSLVLAILFALPLNSNAQVAVIDSSLRPYLVEAIRQNPDLNAWRARVKAAGERISQAGSWADPMVSLSLMNMPVNSFALNQEPMTGAWVNLVQMVPITRKFSAREKIAGWMAERDQFHLEGRELTIGDQVAQGWYNWAYMRAAVATVDTTINILDGLIEISLTRYQTGKGLQQDVLRLQTERTRFQDRLAQLQQAALTAGRRFAVLLGRTPQQVPAPPAGLVVEFPSLFEDSLYAQLARTNPNLAGVQRGRDIAGENVKQAKRSLWPDIRFTAGYGHRQTAANGMDRSDFLSMGAGFTIPIFAGSKQKPAIQEAVALKNEAEENLRDTEHKLQLTLATLLDTDRRLEQQIGLYHHGVLPEAEATLEASMAAWSTGKVDVDGLLNTEIALTNARLELLARVRDRAKTRSSMDALLGGPSLLNRPETPARKQDR